MTNSLLFLACAVAMTCPLARADWVEVPGTTWRYRAEDDWQAAQIRLIVDLAERLPPEYRNPGTTVSLRLRASRFDAESDSFELARVSRYRPLITLSVLGLDEHLLEPLGGIGLAPDPAALEGAAAILVQRALVHELTHIIDRRKRLSADLDWRRHSGWTWWSRVVYPFSPHTTGEFATPWGARSPAEDLATFAEVYFIPPPLGPFDAELSPKCMFPAKYAYMSQEFGPNPDQATEVVCSGPESVGLSPDRVGMIDILYATPSLSRAASVGGHLLIAIEVLGDSETSWVVYTLVADDTIEEKSKIEHLVFGMFGGYRSHVVNESIESTIGRYVVEQNRDLLRYRLLLSPEEKALLLHRLDDISLHWGRPYLFLQQNCSALIIELFNTFAQELIPPTALSAPDMILAELARRGRLESVTPIPSVELSASSRARYGSMLRDEMADNVCGVAFPSLWSPIPDEREIAYREVVGMAMQRQQPDCWRELARLYRIAADLEGAFRLTHEDTVGDKLESLRAAVVDEVPPEERASAAVQADSALLERYHALNRSGPATEYTPYAPTLLGAGTSFSEAGEVVPFIFFRRSAIELWSGQPRMFAPARGVDLNLLDATVAVSAHPSISVAPRTEIFDFGYCSDRILRVARGCVRSGVLTARARFPDRDAWIRWAHVDVGAGFVGRRREQNSFASTVGVELHSKMDGDSESSPFSSWAVAPLAVQFSLFMDKEKEIQAGVRSTVRIAPGIEFDRTPSLTGGVSGQGWLLLGKSRQALMKLELEWRLNQTFVGDSYLPGNELMMGLRLERR